MHPPNAISYHMQELLENELRPGERVVWSQQPIPGVMALKVSPVVLLGIPIFLGGLLFMMMAGGSWGDMGSDSFPAWFVALWSSMFIFVGGGVVLSPVWVYWKALRTVYAITDQRALLIVDSLQLTTCSFAGQQLADIRRVEEEDGRGDIVFYTRVRGETGDASSYEDVGFLGLERVRQVEATLRELHASTTAT